MAESNLQIPLAKGPLALVIIVGVIVVRLLSIGESDDPKLRAAIDRELLSKMGGSIGTVLEDIDPADSASIDALVEMSNSANIAVHSVRVSKPLLAFGSSDDAIVRVEYTLPGQSAETDFWRFEHSIAGGWRYQRPSSIVAYYLNFF